MTNIKKRLSLVLSIWMMLSLVITYTIPTQVVYAGGLNSTSSGTEEVVVVVNDGVSKIFQKGIEYSNSKFESVNKQQGGQSAGGNTIKARRVKQDKSNKFKGGGGGTTTDIDVMKVDGGKITFYPRNIASAKQKEVEIKIGAVLDYVMEDGGVTTQELNDFSDQLATAQNQEIQKIIIPIFMAHTQADLLTGYKILSPFLSFIRILFGAATIIVIFILVGSTIMDLIYISFPVWRNNMDNKAQEKGRRKPFGVSYDALYTVAEVEKDMENSYKNAMFIYFKKRAVAYIVMALCIMYLVIGGLSTIISWLLSLSAGITG